MNEIVTKQNVDYLRIYEYTDLSNFKFLDRNRLINRRHVNKLKRDMLDSGVDRMPPITVDINTFLIIDGQHRKIAFSELWDLSKISRPLKVIFVDAPTDKDELLKYIIALNVKGKHWVLSDFIHAANFEGSSVSKLDDFCNDDSRPLLHKTNKKGVKSPNYRYGMAITIGRDESNSIKKDSTVNISDEDFVAAAKYYEEAEKIIESSGLSTRIGAWVEGFLQAWYSVRKDPAYSNIINKIGIDNICEALGPSDIITTKKEQWESAFKSVIWGINSRN